MNSHEYRRELRNIEKYGGPFGSIFLKLVPVCINFKKLVCRTPSYERWRKCKWFSCEMFSIGLYPCLIYCFWLHSIWKKQEIIFRNSESIDAVKRETYMYLYIFAVLNSAFMSTVGPVLPEERKDIFKHGANVIRSTNSSLLTRRASFTM